MNLTRRVLSTAWVSVALVASASTISAIEFESDIAPILEKRCSKCHGAKKQQGGLRFDNKAAALRGGDSGRAIIPSKSAESLLVQLIEGRGEEPVTVMPPRGKRLTVAEIALVRRWIDEGAEWKGDTKAATISSDHWSLQPLTKPALPNVAKNDWVRSPIDAFVLEKLAKKGLTPNPDADRATLIRRLKFDLLGLPPSPEEIHAFVSDKDPRAYEELIERYLASPHYGERWARHWLDIARYTESQGYEYDRLRGNAWHYRDYVVDSFNADKPFDQFAREQIAGDVLEPVTSETTIATSLLVCGPYDQAGNSQRNQTQRKITREEELEDLVSVVSQSFLGMTVNCARCHSHKFDPIPQTDYYRIKSVFEGVKHGERDVVSKSEREARQKRIDELQGKVGELTSKIATLEGRARKVAQEKRAKSGEKGPDGPAPFARWTFDGDSANDVVGGLHGKLEGGARIQGGRLILDGKDDFLITPAITKDIRQKTLEAWVVLPDLGQGGGGAISLETGDGSVFDSIVYAERERRRWMSGSESHRRTENIVRSDETAKPDELVHVAITYAENGNTTIYRNGEKTANPYRKAQSPKFSRGNARVLLGKRHTGGGRAYLKGEIEQASLYDRELTAEEIRASFESSGRYVSPADIAAELSQAERDEIAAAKKEIEKYRAEIDRRPSNPKSYVGRRQQPKPTRRLIKGNVREPAEEVAPGALSAIAALSGDFGLAVDAPEAERRIRFAKWLTDAENPLPPRVLVNRIWHYHFGRGIVGTPNDFGAMGEKPTHPELLDWLASTFVEGGWKIKSLHRLILTSSAYRQSSRSSEKASSVDADNHLLWRFTPRRLEAEALRDALLAISGKLELKLGGPSFRPFTTSSYGSVFYKIVDRDSPEFNRRTIYRMNVNSGKDPLLDCFDCPDPAVKAPNRRATTTPLQALSLMNNSFVNRQARVLAEKITAKTDKSAEAAVDHAYLEVLGRRPSDDERTASVAVVLDHGLTTLCWTLFNASEFLYVR